MKHQHLADDLLALEKSIKLALIDSIDLSKHKSKSHANNNCLKVSIFNYVELIFIHDALYFIDSKGNMYSLYSECTNEDLIDILNEIE
jgi:hypothetical protein